MWAVRMATIALMAAIILGIAAVVENPSERKDRNSYPMRHDRSKDSYPLPDKGGFPSRPLEFWTTVPLP